MGMITKLLLLKQHKLLISIKYINLCVQHLLASFRGGTQAEVFISITFILRNVKFQCETYAFLKLIKKPIHKK